MYYVPNAQSSLAVITATGKSSCEVVGGIMQNFSPSASSCKSGTLRDSRDSEEYMVAKLDDNRWWMLDNLRLSSTSVGLTSSNSNVAYTNSNPWYLPASDSTNSSYTAKGITADYKNTIAPVTYGEGSGKIGVYYNYCATTAGTYCVRAGSGHSNASYDICPAGWRLPTDNEYSSLCSSIKGSGCVRSDTDPSALELRVKLSTPLSGYTEEGRVVYQGVRSQFWTSVASGNGNNMQTLAVNDSDVSAVNFNSYRSRNLSIRCILK